MSLTELYEKSICIMGMRSLVRVKGPSSYVGQLSRAMLMRNQRTAWRPSLMAEYDFQEAVWQMHRNSIDWCGEVFWNLASRGKL